MLKRLLSEETIWPDACCRLIVSLPVVSTLTYVILKQNAVRAAHDMGRLHPTTMEAVKRGIKTPYFIKSCPGRLLFIYLHSLKKNE